MELHAPTHRLLGANVSLFPSRGQGFETKLTKRSQDRNLREYLYTGCSGTIFRGSNFWAFSLRMRTFPRTEFFLPYGWEKYYPREKQILDIKPCCTRQYVHKTFSLLMKTCMRCLLFLRSFNLVLEYEKIIYFCFPFHTCWSACSPYIPLSEA